MKHVLWKDEPDNHDYPAAAAYLSLLAAPDRVTVLVDRLHAASLTHQKAKDILRAAGLALLPVENAHVAADLDKVKNETPLSPILLVQGDLDRAVPLQIADGYHRVCASYHIDENTDIPCRVAGIDG